MRTLLTSDISHCSLRRCLDLWTKLSQARSRLAVLPHHLHRACRPSAWLAAEMRTPSLFGLPLVLQSLTSCSSSRNTAPSMSRSVVCKPTWWHPTFASCRTQAPATPCKPSRASSQAPGWAEPTPFRISHLSGTGGSDGAECARRIARLSLRLVRPQQCMFVTQWLTGTRSDRPLFSPVRLLQHMRIIQVLGC